VCLFIWKGHFLGLLHTFGDNTCNVDSKGDFVNDTPQHISRASIVNCKSDPSTWDTCPLLPGIDPVDNYMSKGLSKGHCLFVLNIVLMLLSDLIHCLFVLNIADASFRSLS
jgi:Pregnancy-associated plasma protein-A